MSKEDGKERKPEEPRDGAMRHNPADKTTEIYVGGSWLPVSMAVDAASTSVNTDPIVFSTTPSTTTGPIMTGGSGGWTSTGTTTTGIMMAPEAVPVPARQKKPDRKLVEFPRRVTRKVIIGFVEDDDEVVWAAKLKILDFHVDFDNQDGEGRITLVTDIEDVGA